MPGARFSGTYLYYTELCHTIMYGITTTNNDDGGLRYNQKL